MFKAIRPVDKSLLITILALVIFGNVMVYDASVVYSGVVFGEKYHFAFQQILWVVVGLLGMLIISQLDESIIKKYSPLAFFITFFMLLLVILPLPTSPIVYGARRWLVLNPKPLPLLPIIGRISFQPSELAKLTSITFVSFFLSSAKKKRVSPLIIMRNFTFIILAVSGLIFLEPDFTTTFVLVSTLVVIYFIADGRLLYFLIGGPIIALVASFYAFTSKYRRERITALFNPETVDKLGNGYHINQIMIALGSGGLTGLGFGKSRQKYSYLPEVTSDSIFAVIGEEFGFIGAALLVIMLTFLVFRGIKISQHVTSSFMSLASIGVVSWITLQTIINLGAMVRLIPLTGVPLPLISYGGSSTIFMLWGLGLVLNASRDKKLEQML